MKRLVLGLCAALMLTSAAHAGSGSGTVSVPKPHIYDKVFFKTSTVSNAPACNTVGEWAIDLSTYSGRAMFATILSAEAQGKSVSVSGLGTCTVWGDREDVKWLHINP